MIEELIVHNLGLIGEAHLEPGPGLVVITGETGTGKTMLLGAVELLLGRPASSDLVGPVDQEARVQGRFVFEDRELVVSRRVVEAGRSRAYVDGDMVAARALGEHLENEIEVVKQGDARRLSDPTAFRTLVDGCLDAAGHDALQMYEEAWRELTRIRADQELAGGDMRAIQRDLEMARFQSEEISAAGFALGEEEELARRSDRLRFSRELADTLGEARQHLDEQDHLAMAVVAMRRAASFDSSLQPISDQLDGLQAEWAEAASAVRDVAATIEHNPDALEEVEDRLATLSSLKRKYGNTLEEVLAFGEEAEARVVQSERLLQRAGELGDELAVAVERVEVGGEALRAARVRAGKLLGETATGHLRDLGFADPVLRVEIAEASPGPLGADRMQLLFASDAALQPLPAHTTASGGELSRVILAVRLATGASDTPIVVFDEVDAGVGGATALAMGEKLAHLAESRQVFCVTHLPQVAAFADRHFVVDRTGVSARVRPAVAEDLVAELTRMMAGLGDSKTGRDHAVELLQTAKARRG
ncbi:MAG: AAA family ATPase [Acidimicrobiia bacterium]|nr:AAA family ATPase [Acidimicrobiia bacterium]